MFEFKAETFIILYIKIGKGSIINIAIIANIKLINWLTCYIDELLSYKNAKVVKFKNATSNTPTKIFLFNKLYLKLI